MRSNSMITRGILWVCISPALLFSFASAQQSASHARINQLIDETKLTVLRGNTHPLARRQFDRGPAPANLPLDRMLLVLRRSEAQESSLKALLDQQQDKSSLNYHKWLTPVQFGQQFGPPDQDIQTVKAWLESHGLQVKRVANGRTIIEFSGTAAQMRDAFHVEIHRYVVNGKERWANSADPQIPTALTSVVAGVATLHSFPRTPLHHIVGVVSRASNAGQYQLRPSSPQESSLFTVGEDCGLAGGPCYALAPYDLATIYNMLPLWNATSPIDGTGQTIAIVGQSDIYPQDFSNFRSDFGLPPATLNIILNGPDPGKLATEGDELESDLDVEWAGAVAKGATIDFIVSASTNSSAGIDLSAEYIVDNDLAPVMSESYGACELDMGTTGNQFYSQLWQQAAAEGITAFVPTGDSGSAGCDQNLPLATQGLAVNGISSTPYNVAVGGTDFNDSQDESAYWNSTNDPVTQASAKSYIPESTWNNSCTNSEFFALTASTTPEGDCNDSSSSLWPDFLAPVGGSGGASNCTTSANQSLASCSGGYAKPIWQTGAGVPNDRARDIPDVSLFAGSGLNASSYVVCETDIYGGCAGGVNNSELVAVGGTSASAPAFAGIMAMVNQKTQSSQGNANYVLYPLAAQPESSCNSSGTIGSACIFYDITTGTIAMPCASGSPNCVTNVSGDQNGVLFGYGTTAGYDLATGLGSVNVANLVNNWSSISFQPTISTLSLSPTTQITHGSPVKVNVTVAPKLGTGTPTGMVSLKAGTGPQAGEFTLSNGSVSATTGLLPGGSYNVTAHYEGDGTYAASDSSPAVPVTVNPEPSTTTVEAFTLDQKDNSTPFASGPYGDSVIYLRTSVAGQSGQGIATGAVNLSETLNGTTTNFTGDPYSLNSDGYTMTPLPGGYYVFFTPGTYSIAASYSGDSSFKPSVSSVDTFTITQAQTSTTTNIPQCSQSSQCFFITGSGVITIFATISTNSNKDSSSPSGTITFYSNGAPLGPPAVVDTSVSPPTASFSTNQLPLGQDNITAQYSGDANYTGSLSSAISVEVVTSFPTFAITANPMTVTIASPGQSGSTVLTFAAQNFFTGSVTLSPSMCMNLPSESSCSFSPANVNLTSSATTVPVTLTVATTAPTSVASLTRPVMSGLRRKGGVTVVWVIGVCTLLVGGIVRRRWSPTIALLGLALIASAVACGSSPSGSGGSGGGGGNGGTGGNPGTPVGNYAGVTVTVPINGTPQSINLTVNVR